METAQAASTGGRRLAGRHVALVVDANGWPNVAVARSLWRRGWRVIAPTGTKAARTPFCAGQVPIPDAGKDAGAFVDAVGRAIERFDVDLVAPAEDSSLELLYETEGLLGDAVVLGGDRESARLVLDKTRTLEAAERAGFPIPGAVVPRDLDEAASAARDFGFPCVVKPRSSYGGDGKTRHGRHHTVVHSPAETRRAVQSYLDDGYEMQLVQEWVHGRSMGTAAVVRGGRVLAHGTREAVTQAPPAGGTAVWRKTIGPNEPGVQEALELLVSVGFEGMGDVQYHVEPDGTPKLMELGARVYGWLPLTIAAGADLPAIAVAALEGEEPDEPVVARAGVEMRWVKGELMRLGYAIDPNVQLPPGLTRGDVVRGIWPPWRPGMLYDGHGLHGRFRWL